MEIYLGMQGYLCILPGRLCLALQLQVFESSCSLVYPVLRGLVILILIIFTTLDLYNDINRLQVQAKFKVMCEVLKFWMSAWWLKQLMSCTASIVISQTQVLTRTCTSAYRPFIFDSLILIKYNFAMVHKRFRAMPGPL